MLNKSTLLGSILFALFSMNVFGADIPQVDIQSQEFNKDECINNNTQNCINAQCLTSEALDCQEQCGKLATAQCEEQADD